MKESSHLLFLALVLLLSSGSFAQTGFWEQTNGPYGGNIRAILITPNKILFAGAEGQGVFRSEDGGDNWTQCNNGLPLDQPVSALALDSAGVLYAGTQGAGVFRSSDEGKNWTQVINGMTNLTVNALAVDPANRVYAGAYLGLIFYSTDQGATWHGASTPGFVYPVFSLCPGPPGKVYAGSARSFGEAGYGAVYCSSDSGLTWQGFVYVGGGGDRVASMAFAPLCTLFTASRAGGGVAHGSVCGGTWSETEGYDATSLAIDDSGVVYLGVQSIAAQPAGVWRSFTRGASWELATSGLYNLHILSLASDSYLGLYAGTVGGGIFKTVNRADDWLNVSSGIVASTVLGMTCDSTGSLYATTTDFGVYRSTDRGNTWMRFSDGLYYEGLTVGPIAANLRGDVYVILEHPSGYRYIYSSSDHGETWQPFSYSYFYHASAMVCNTSNHLFVASYEQVYRTTDFGASWIYPTVSTYKTITALGLGQSDTIYAGNEYGDAFRSSDNGTTWSKTSTVLTNATIRALAVTQTGLVFCGTDSGLFVSTSNGDSWTKDTSAIPPVTINAIVQNPRGPVVAATAAGSFISRDEGNTWEKVYDASPPHQALSLAVDSAGYFYSGVQNGGVLRSTNSTTGVQEKAHALPKAYMLAQNYPNPFNPVTKIQFTIVDRQLTIVNVYDLVGREVATLVNEVKEPGTYNVQFDGSNFASGVYLYRLQAGTFVQTRKLLLLR